MEKENRFLQQELEKLKSENDSLSKQLMDEEILKNEIKLLQDRCFEYVERNSRLQFENKKRTFNYINLKRDDKEFFLHVWPHSSGV